MQQHLKVLFVVVCAACTPAAHVVGGEIVENTAAGSTILGLGFAAQSVTTPSGGPWDNIGFNFFGNGGNPMAIGSLFVLNQSYGGAPKDLSESTTGFLAQNEDIVSNAWVFDEAFSLNPNTTYFFYMGGTQGFTSGNEYVANTNNPYDGGSSPFSTIADGSGNYGGGAGDDAHFLLQSVPEPSSLALASILMLGWTVGGRRLRRRLR